MTPNPLPDATYIYSTIPVPGQASIKLRMDEYAPVDKTKMYPIMILVHGGGFAKGCRRSMDGLAYSFSHGTVSTHFIGLSIDYRQACNPDDPDIPAWFAYNLCGWTYDTLTTDGASIIDVQAAVAWVRINWRTQSGYGDTLWNGKIALVGGSGGGNLAYMASTLAPVGSDSRPEVVAGWSPFPRFTRWQTGGDVWHWACNSNESRTPTDCSKGAQGPSGYWEGGINRYLPCPNIINGYDSACASLYQVAAPYDVTNSDPNKLPPPVYIANGGGPNGGSSPPEISSLTTALQYSQLLFGLGVERDECVVNNTDHGTRLLGDQCNDGSGTVT